MSLKDFKKCDQPSVGGLSKFAKTKAQKNSALTSVQPIGLKSFTKTAPAKQSKSTKFKPLGIGWRVKLEWKILPEFGSGWGKFIGSVREASNGWLDIVSDNGECFHYPYSCVDKITVLEK